MVQNGNQKITKDEMKSRALAFSRRHRDDVDEDSESQSFLNDFFDVFGFDRKLLATFEKRVPLGSGNTGFIDLLWKGKLLVEMKSRGKNLDAAFSQAKNYVMRLKEAERPIYIMVCDFARIRLYDLTSGVHADEFYEFELQALSRNLRRFAGMLDLEGVGSADEDDERVNIRAAEIMAKLHESMEKMVFSSHDLQVYLVWILFCLFAEDAGIFEKNSFKNYIERSKEDGSDLSGRLHSLFRILDTDFSKRPENTPDELRQFPYVNGKLFSERLNDIYPDAKVRAEILRCCNFDWDYISPAIFGAMFQGVMNPDERREMGAHYTSGENILKVIRPLFLDSLWGEFNRAKSSHAALERFHEYLAGLKFLDPACGCGNFLIIAYRELRKLEFEVIKILHEPKSKGVFFLDVGEFVKVNVDQFYGIEYEEFPSQIAQVGMWLMDHQWNTNVAEYFGYPFRRLPLKQSATIFNGNALTKDWEELVSRDELSYIMGNPPFLGYSMQNEEQKKDMLHTYVDSEGKPLKGSGKIDYVSAWYYKAAKFMQGTNIRAAFVSTNSITQGDQVAFVWKPLYEMFGVSINFAYRTFKWSNEAKGKAAVHCVIVGFDVSHLPNQLRYIFDESGEKKTAQNISPYLLDGATIFVESRKLPLCNVPQMTTGNRPGDGGNLIIEEEAYEDFVTKEPKALKYIKKLVGSDEYINNKKRWCLWLVNAPPSEIKAMPEVLKRVEACKKDREGAKDEGRRKLAKTPTLFREHYQPNSEYIVIPKVSSERRDYVPIGFLNPDVIASDLLFVLPHASLYHFGILTSGIHMAWMRAVCGRLEMRYRYSKDVVYNTFPWPNPTDGQKAAIEICAQAVLDARELYPDSSLADLYDPLTMPPELSKAHANLDKAVEKAYGIKFSDEGEIVGYLMERYRELTAEKQA